MKLKVICFALPIVIVLPALSLLFTSSTGVQSVQKVRVDEVKQKPEHRIAATVNSSSVPEIRTVEESEQVQMDSGLTGEGDFFSSISVDPKLIAVFAKDLQVHEDNIFPVEMDIRKLGEFRPNDKLSLTLDGRNLDFYITKVEDAGNVRSITGNLFNSDVGLYFGLSFSEEDNTIDGLLMTEAGVYEVHTLYGNTIFVKAPLRNFD